jgi:hypothetical protein
MPIIEIARIQVRRGQENQTGVPTLAGGEFGWAADTEHLYIGLRREDGGSRDENVRILTENDLDNFFDAVVTNNSAYIYRENSLITADQFGAEYNRLVINKLDEFVSVTDFGVVGLGGVSNDAELLQRAIDRLFLNSSTYEIYNTPGGISPSKVLLFPTGVYNIDTCLRLPPHTTIIGEGIGKTIINLTSTATNAFITVDGQSGGVDAGDSYITFPSITSGPNQPNYIHIEGMTVQYDSTLATGIAECLLSLDCSENAVIRKVRFAGTITEYTSALSKGYSGIDIRGQGALQASSENVLIDNCEFDGLYHGVKSNYDISNPIIQNSKFYNSIRGVSFNDPKDGAADVGPRLARICNNRFENIHQQAIYSGVNSSNTGTDHISMNNQFYNVGNLGGGRGSTTGTAVITYLTDGNISVNDFFDRKLWNVQHLNLSTPYHPLIEGRAVIDSVSVSTTTLFATSTTPVMRFPTTGYAQQVSVKYSIFQNALAPLSFTLWNSTSTYNTGNLVIDTLSGKFSSVVDNNLANPPTIDVEGVTVLNSLYWAWYFDNTVAIDRVGTIEFYIPANNVRMSGTDLIVSDNYNYSGDGSINNNITWFISVNAGNTFYQIWINHGSIYNLTIEYQTKLMI